MRRRRALPRLRPWARAALLAGALGICPLASAAEEEAQVPLSTVVLYNSGVGYYEHFANVDGNAQVTLRFETSDINDLLKSMVLQDLGGGRIESVTYGSQEPIERTLRSFAIDLTSNPTLGDLLLQIRGEQIEVDAPQPLSGTIVGIERRPEQIKEQTITREYLTLLTDDGLRSLDLATIGRLKLANADLDRELRQALSVLALGHAQDKKAVTLNFLGEGERPVRVGYVQESPIWKTSYRLVLADDESPLIQGWAIVENTTEQDWENVQLTLVSGRPISFVMNLYQPLFVPRPLVEPELFASLRPQIYGQDLARQEAEFAAAADRPMDEALADMESRSLRRTAGAASAQSAFDGAALYAAAGEGLPQEKRDFGVSVQSVAQAGDVGELFHYQIETPVSLPRQQSAMLPIVNGPVEAEKLSIYNPAVHGQHPLNGLRLKNTTGLHLMQGPITVFDGGSYAGDAQIQDLPPDSERLISYALDLDVEVAPETKGHPDEMLRIRLIHGVLYVQRKLTRTQLYVVKNGDREDRQVLIEYPHDPSWSLVTPAEPAETTRDLYRFAVVAEPGKPATLTIEEEMHLEDQLHVNNLDDGTIQFYIGQAVASDKVKAALQEIIQRKREILETAQQRQTHEQEIAVIGQEQQRIRENMAQLDRGSDLYKRYVSKFTEQEERIEALRMQIAELTEHEQQQRQSLDEYLLSLEL